MLRKYSTIIGAITKAILTGSIVGVIIAESAAIATMAILQYRTSVWAVTKPKPANAKMINGN